LKRALKHQIREDEFRSGLSHGLPWLQAHARELRVLVPVLLLAAAAVFGVRSYRDSRETAASKAYVDALRIYAAPVHGELAPGSEPPAGEAVYATAEEKYTQAAAAFDGIERRYPGLPAARRAAYYAALCRIELGQTDAAETALMEIAATHTADGLTPALARFALADLLARRGEVDRAVDAYRQLADDAQLPLPRDYALLRLARVLEDAGRASEARASYRQLAEQYPASVYAAEARSRVDYLATAAG